MNEVKKLDELEAQEELERKRKQIKTFEDLIKYLEDVKDNYNYDYGVAPRAIGQATLAVAWFLSEQFGITGFQAGCVPYLFIRGWNKPNNKCGLDLVDYDNMLYPQCEEQFQKIISKNCWIKLQEEANRNLLEHNSACNEVINHWKSIIDGKVPFGYEVKDEE